MFPDSVNKGILNSYIGRVERGIRGKVFMGVINLPQQANVMTTSTYAFLAAHPKKFKQLPSTGSKLVMLGARTHCLDHRAMAVHNALASRKNTVNTDDT